MHKIRQNIKIKIKNKEQFEKIQKICFKNNIFWKLSGECLQQEFSRWICIRDVITSGIMLDYPGDLEEVDADLFIKTNGRCVEDNSRYYSPFFTLDQLLEIDCEYLIFVEGKSKPSKIHSSLDEAEKEARRLCEKEMKEVYILKSIKKFKPIITIEEI